MAEVGRSLAINFSFFGAKNWKKYPQKGNWKVDLKRKRKVILESAGTDGSDKRGKQEAGAGC